MSGCPGKHGRVPSRVNLRRTRTLVRRKCGPSGARSWLGIESEVVVLDAAATGCGATGGGVWPWWSAGGVGRGNRVFVGAVAGWEGA